MCVFPSPFNSGQSAGSKAEIWDRKKYDEMFGAAVFDDETFSNKIAEFGVQL